MLKTQVNPINNTDNVKIGYKVSKTRINQRERWIFKKLKHAEVEKLAHQQLPS